MGKVQKAGFAKLIVGLLFCRPDLLPLIYQRLEETWGPLDLKSPVFSFAHTDYYQREMGDNLGRNFVSLANLISLENLSPFKLFSNTLEEEFSLAGRREVNIDPGFLDASKMVLLTTKDFFHRAYLGQGIYAHLNLHFQKGAFQSFPWTYPDYLTPEALEFFAQVRKRYLDQVKLGTRC